MSTIVRLCNYFVQYRMMNMAKKSTSVKNFSKTSMNPYVLSSMYGKMLVNQNQETAKCYPWSRVDVSVPTDMHGATQNVQEGP